MPTQSDIIWIGNDHGGYDLKNEFVRYLTEHEYAVHDIGCAGTEIVRYPKYAIQLAEAVSSGRIRRGILICSTGIGMSIVANRFKGVRASLCTSTYLARMTREHNDSNLLCMGGRVTGVFEALDILETWLHTAYQGGRHDISLNLIRELDGGITIPEAADLQNICERSV
ncbi:MAG: ribose 5-phosphate isomerase B [Spirochaetales bacterium]|jgi:ribose 5-phosphate isomerase B|nr:ribose 5-phosphate isomerase B [Spirochaetales bacterium]